MGRPRIYKDATEARQAENARKARYKVEKQDSIQAFLPKGYKEKLVYIAQRMNPSKARVLKMLIEREFEKLKDE